MPQAKIFYPEESHAAKAKQFLEKSSNQSPEVNQFPGKGQLYPIHLQKHHVIFVKKESKNAPFVQTSRMGDLEAPLPHPHNSTNLSSFLLSNKPKEYNFPLLTLELHLYM